MMPPLKCYIHEHLTPEEFAVWDLAKRVSSRSGTFNMSMRAIAGHFEDFSKDRANRAFHGLVKRGFFDILLAGQRDSLGYRLPDVIRVVTHEQLQERHPDRCVEVKKRVQVALLKARENKALSHQQDKGNQSLVSKRGNPLSHQ